MLNLILFSFIFNVRCSFHTHSPSFFHLFQKWDRTKKEKKKVKCFLATGNQPIYTLSDSNFCKTHQNCSFYFLFQVFFASIFFSCCILKWDKTDQINEKFLIVGDADNNNERMQKKKLSEVKREEKMLRYCLLAFSLLVG